MTDITVQVAIGNGQMQTFVIAEQELCFSAIRRFAEHISETGAPKHAPNQLVYVDEDGDRCILSDASLSDALTFCKQGALKLQVVRDELTGEQELQEKERGVALADKELAGSDDEWEMVQAGCQAVCVVDATSEVDQHLDLGVESLPVFCEGVSPASAFTSAVNQRSDLTNFQQVSREDIPDIEGDRRLPAECKNACPPFILGFPGIELSGTLAGGEDDIKLPAATLGPISELVSLGYSKEHAQLALAAEGGDVNRAALRLLCTRELFASYDRELVMYVLAEQGGDIECALAVLRQMSELAQVYQGDSLNQTILNATSNMGLAIAELGQQFEKAGDIAISSTSKAVDRARQSLSEVSQRVRAGLQPMKGWIRSS